MSRAAQALRGSTAVRAQRVLAGTASAVLLALPQLIMPHEWVRASGLAAHEVWRPVASGLVCLLFVPLLRLVSYRRRDWLVLAFVPGWQYVIAFRVGSRAALLPLRDWPARPEERLRVRKVSGTRFWVLLPEPRTAAERAALRRAAKRVPARGRERLPVG